MKKISLYLLLLQSITLTSISQGNITRPAKTVQPKIMVIPKTKDGEDLRKMYDSGTIIRVAVAKINESFVNKGASVVSFDARYKEVKENKQLNESSNDRLDVKTDILSGSGADVYVQAEVNVVRHHSINANSVSVILEAYHVGTGNYLGVASGRSRINRTEDIAFLTAQAMDTITFGFLNLIQQRFDDIQENGQSVYVQFTISNNATIDFDTEVGPEKRLLSELIDEWFSKISLNGVYNNQGVVSNMMIISDVRIPLKDPNNSLKNYNGQNLINDMLKFIRSLGIKAKREIGTNNKILITIQ
jgi:hypothetical protein